MSATHQALLLISGLYIFKCMRALPTLLPTWKLFLFARDPPQQLNRTQHGKCTRKKCAALVLFVGRGLHTQKRANAAPRSFFLLLALCSPQFFLGDFAPQQTAQEIFCFCRAVTPISLLELRVFKHNFWNFSTRT
jgi:hypothetical protein